MTTSTIVEPSKIQEGLDSLWAAKDNTKTVKASLFNIIFFTKKSPRDEYIRKIAYKLIEKFPARIFFITSDPTSSEDSLKTAVSVMTTEQGEYSITCDLIEISAQGKGEKQVPFLLLPHIISDLPIYLVWSEDPAKEDTLCNELQSFATRIIFDSECTEDLCKFSQSVVKLQKANHLEIADLNWGRLESWRDLLAATFSKLEKVEELQRTSSIKITYNSQTTAFFCHTKIQSIYLQAWIASRLKWTPDKKRTASIDLTRFFYEHQGQSVEVQLVGVKADHLPSGMILSLELKTSEEEHYVFSRDENVPHQISLNYSTKNECQLPVKFLISKEESGQSLVKEICHKGTSEHYQEVLEMISNWQRSALC
jgi:glucose-6-phosphate dehydrogenase assembly protein OpcA